MRRRRKAPQKPRLIIMRHSERVDYVVRNSNWPAEVFINGVYSPNITQLPTVLPLRADPHEYLLDTPLTRYGKAHAHRTGEHLRSFGLMPDRVFTSPAMRCVQTADAVLDGLGVRGKRPLKIDLALYEPTRKELPLQSASFFSSAGFNVDYKYQPLLPGGDSRLILGESRLQYYHRMYDMLKRITANLILKNKKSTAPTTLVVTHRSGVTLLASMLNLDTIDDKLTYLNELETSKRNEVNFLSMIIAEYDAATGLWSFLSDYPQ